jgi:predicted metal-dependent RNase
MDRLLASEIKIRIRIRIRNRIINTCKQGIRSLRIISEHVVKMTFFGRDEGEVLTDPEHANRVTADVFYRQSLISSSCLDWNLRM